MRIEEVGRSDQQGHANVLNILSVRVGIELDTLIDKGLSKKRTRQLDIFKPLSGEEI
jgi:hypothetical protein